MIKEIINTDKAPAPIGPYNQSVKANGLLFISGQIAIDPVTGNIDAGAELVLKAHPRDRFRIDTVPSAALVRLERFDGLDMRLIRHLQFPRLCVTTLTSAYAVMDPE